MRGEHEDAQSLRSHSDPIMVPYSPTEFTLNKDNEEDVNNRHGLQVVDAQLEDLSNTMGPEDDEESDQLEDLSNTIGPEDDEESDDVDEHFGLLDIGDFGHTVPEGVDDTILPPGFSEQDFANAAEYLEERQFLGDDGPLAQFIDRVVEEGEEVPELEQHQEVVVPMPPPEMPGSRKAFEYTAADTSVLVPHRDYNSGIHLTDFGFALGLMTHFLGMSNTGWETLRQILQMRVQPDDLGTRLDPDLSDLPKALRTFKGHVTRRLPLFSMRKVTVKLIAEKLPTLPASQKPEDPSQHVDTEAGAEKRILTKDVYFLDPEHLFTTLFTSLVGDMVYRDIAVLVEEDLRTEIYHGLSWATSIRTTSGNYAHYINEHGETEGVIFPGDFIYYVCNNQICKCQAWDAPLGDLHIGQVHAVWKEGRHEANRYRKLTGQRVLRGTILLSLRECFRSPRDLHKIPRSVLDTIGEIDDDELVVQLSSRLIEATDAVDICNITKDMTFGRCLKDPSWAEPLPPPNEPDKPKPRTPRPNWRKLPGDAKKKAHKRRGDKYIVRYAFDIDTTTGEAS
jgi:hypothetical protein